MTQPPTDAAREEVQVRANLDAYYFSFEPTGDADIDRILGAVAYAGKAYHHTEDWTETDILKVSCERNIQNAANLAAATRLAVPTVQPAGSDVQKSQAGCNTGVGREEVPRHTAEAGGVEGRYLVWSNEHQAWWGKDRCGYTRVIERAGRYDRAEALSIAGTRDGGWHVRKGNPDEIAIPEQDAIDQSAAMTRAQDAALPAAVAGGGA